MEGVSGFDQNVSSLAANGYPRAARELKPRAAPRHEVAGQLVQPGRRNAAIRVCQPLAEVTA